MREDKKEFYKKLGQKIRIMRKAMKWNQERLGKELHMSKSAVSEMEAGKSYIHTPKLQALCKIFQTTPNEFLEWNQLNGITASL